MAASITSKREKAMMTTSEKRKTFRAQRLSFSHLKPSDPIQSQIIERKALIIKENTLKKPMNPNEKIAAVKARV